VTTRKTKEKTIAVSMRRTEQQKKKKSIFVLFKYEKLSLKK